MSRSVGNYRPRDAEHAVLYRVLDEHLDAFLAFDLDVLACPRCGGRLRLIATVEDPEAIRAILGALGGWREREGRAPPGAAGAPPSPAGVLGA